jgi:hypothetical protein
MIIRYRPSGGAYRAKRLTQYQGGQIADSAQLMIGITALTAARRLPGSARSRSLTSQWRLADEVQVGSSRIS